MPRRPHFSGAGLRRDRRPPRSPSAPSARRAPPPMPMPSFLSAADLQRLILPEPTYIVPGLVPTGLTLLTAKPKAGKSWLALQLGAMVATGGRFLERDLEQGDVLYFALEDNQRRIKTRLGQLVGAAPFPPALNFAFEAPQIGNDLLRLIGAWSGTVLNPRLVIIDTLGRAMPPGGSRDPYAFATRTLGPLQRLGLDRDLAVLIIHHNRKGGSESGDAFDEIHGSTALLGVADASLVLRRQRQTPHGSLHVTGRDIDEAELSVELDPGSGRWSVTVPDPLSGLSPEKLAVVAALASGIQSPTDIASALGKGRTTIQNHLTELHERKIAVKPETGKYVLAPGIAVPTTASAPADATDDADANTTTSACNESPAALN